MVLIPMPMGGSTVQRVPKPIPAAAIHDWARAHGLDVDEMTAFRERIDAMDRVAVEHLGQAVSAAASQPPPEQR